MTKRGQPTKINWAFVDFDRSPTELAKELGVSRQTVHEHRRRAQAKDVRIAELEEELAVAKSMLTKNNQRRGTNQ